MRTIPQRSAHRRTLAEACPETIAEFAEVERELERVGLPVPPTSPFDTVTGRFLALLAQADDYDRACATAAISA